MEFIEGAKEQVIELLLTHGVDINAVDGNGFTPLHEAARSADLTAATYLVKRGAAISPRTKQGQTSLHLAAAGRPKITKLLIDAGADANALNGNGLSPLAYSEQECSKNDENEEPYLEAQRELRNAGRM